MLYDAVFDELENLAKENKFNLKELSIAMTIYIFGFGTYKGFKKI